MHQIRFAGCAFLPLVLARRKEVGPPQQIEVCLRMVPPDFLTNFFDANHRNKAVSRQSTVVSCDRLFLIN